MTREKLEQAVGEIKNCREDVIDKLVQFAPTDSLLFWANNDELIKKQEELWNPILSWANQEINAKYITTKDNEIIFYGDPRSVVPGRYYTIIDHLLGVDPKFRIYYALKALNTPDFKFWK